MKRGMIIGPARAWNAAIVIDEDGVVGSCALVVLLGKRGLVHAEGWRADHLQLAVLSSPPSSSPLSQICMYIH